MAEHIPGVTVLLQRWRAGDDNAASDLLREVYGDLRGLARAYMRRERQSHTLQATALVSEAWLRLARVGAPSVADRQQFFRAMAAYMRRHLVDHARRRGADKRGSGQPCVELSDVDVHAAGPAVDETETHLQYLDRALEHLRAAHPRAAKIVELRFFAGQSVEQVAAALSVGSGTVKRDFAFAKTFLFEEINSQAQASVTTRSV